MRRQEVSRVSALESDVATAQRHLDDLKNELGHDHPLLASITTNELRNNRSLRHDLANYKAFYHFMTPRHKKELKERKFNSEEDKRVAAE
jgi:hypothetical protein